MAAPVVPTYLVSALAASVRLDSDLNASQILTDAQIATIISDAGSSLRDVFSGANQHYDVSQFAFTLSGGVNGNATNLPADFQHGHSVDVNPGTSQPYTLRYLSNWLDRNQLSGAPFSTGGPGGGPREYYFLGSNPGQLVVLPAMGAAGNFLLYYTPMWVPLAIPSVISVLTASIPLIPTTTMGFNVGHQFSLDTGPPTFQATDVGNFITVTGATNPGNNGSWTITSFASTILVGVAGVPISETFPGGATATLSRASFVTAAGVWTFFGANQFTQTTGSINVGDSITVKGAANAGNNGTFVVTAVGLNTVTTAGVAGLVAENFATGTVTVTSQLAGTRPDLPANMNPWVLYLKTMACITIRNKRGQDVEAFMARLNVDQQRIEKILQERQEEPTQPPLTRGAGGYGYGGAW